MTEQELSKKFDECKKLLSSWAPQPKWGCESGSDEDYLTDADAMRSWCRPNNPIGKWTEMESMRSGVTYRDGTPPL
jgi:hypothetical protein